MRIYLDHNATTPLREEVVAAMLPALRDGFGNPSSTHAEGAAARAAVDRAREQVAALIGAEPRAIFFTAGATEANNTVFRGLPDAGGRHLVTSTVEHPSVVAPVASLESGGWRVTRVGVDGEGRLEPAAVAAAIRPETALVSIIWANNETGVIQPMDEIASAVKDRGALLHVDATQALGKHPVDLRSVPVDLLSASAHKLNGPKGVGCLAVR